MTDTTTSLLQPGDEAPSFVLPALESGDEVADPWKEGPVVLAFFKVSCPVCQMVAPKVAALAAAGVPVVAIGEDPLDDLAEFRTRHGQGVPTLSEPDPYEVSAAYGLTSVPTLFAVGADGVITDTIACWDRDRWNALSASFGGGPVSAEDDGLPVFRPG